MYGCISFISPWTTSFSFSIGFGNPCSEARGALVAPQGFVSPFCVQFGERIFCRKILHFKSRNGSFWTFDMPPFFCLVHVEDKNEPRKRGFFGVDHHFGGHHIGLPKIGGWQIRSGAVSNCFGKNDDGIFVPKKDRGGTGCSTMLYGYCCTER